MPAKVFVFFGFDKMPEVVTKPHPYVDAGGVHMLGDLMKSRMVFLSDALYKLQEKGYALHLDGVRSVIALHPDRHTNEEVERDLTEVGINRADTSVIVKDQGQHLIKTEEQVLFAGGIS